MNKDRVRSVVIALVALVAFAGCGDTTASKLEDARIALDNKDFSKAILLTTELLDKNGDGAVTDQDALTADDAEAAHLLASARFGEAGIDLIAMLDLAEKNGGASKPSVLAKAEDCISDADFRTVSNLIPSILTQNNLTNLELGLVVIDLVISKNLVSDEKKLKDENLLKAIGNAARIIVAIIVATDRNGDNKPDIVPMGVDLNTLVNRVVDSFDATVEALTASGIINSDLLNAITKLKTSSIGDSGNITINGEKLSAYLQGIVNQCT